MKNNSITIAKAIAIILMVMGHAGAPEWLSFLSTVRMPLFFFMSGYCFKEAYLQDAKLYLNRRVNGIYVPYVKYSMLFLLLHNFCFYIGLYDEQYTSARWQEIPLHIYSLQEYLIQAANIMTGMYGHDQLLGGYWFLNSLFFGSCIFYAFAKIRNLYLQLFLIMVSCIFLRYFWIMIPWCHVSARELLAAFFITAGYTYKSKGFKLHERTWLILPLLFVVILITRRVNTNMHLFWWKSVIPYAFAALCGTISIFGISNILNKWEGKIRDFLIFCGNHTFDILTWHFVSFRVLSLLLILAFRLDYSCMSHYPVIKNFNCSVIWIMYWIIGVSLPLGFVMIRNRCWKFKLPINAPKNKT